MSLGAHASSVLRRTKRPILAKNAAAGNQSRQAACAPRTSQTALKGVYGGLVHGVYGFGIPGGPVQFASMPVVTFDGEGNLSGVMTSSDNGTITSFPISGTYQVNPDGTGALIVSFPGGLPDAPVAIVILNNGKEVASIQTDLDTIVIGTLKKQ